MKNILILLFTIFAFAATAQDKVILTTGKVISGKITLINETQINISTPSRDYECPASQVSSYEKDGKIFVPDKKGRNNSPLFAESAGDELMKTAGLFTAGALITTAGFIMTNFASDFIKVGSNDSQEDIDNKVLHIKHLRYFGTGCFVLGSILEISAIIPISAVGKKLNFFMKNDSAGVSMKF